MYILVLMIVGTNYRRYTRKLAGSAMVAGSFSVVNIVGPLTFQTKDAPK